MNVFDLSAKLTLDTNEYERNLADAGERAQGFGDRLRSGLGVAATVGAAALTAASGAVIALTKNAVQNYAEYEQLVGGVETLFKDSADAVQEYAANAYKTAGLSANEYMETVTSFSASLLQSLEGDTRAAAEYADMAITDMSDNANKMGTSMEAIQNAYQGFAKQNYTMLDNLKLGYGGTKTEMERLIVDAENLDSTFRATRGENGELAMSYADIVDAIHIVQTEMGITGTTAKEAASTIQGSVNAMKSAWQNLVVGVADDTADFSGLVDNFVDSVSAVGKNILPRVGQALRGVGSLVTGLAPVIADAVPQLIADVLPTLLQSAVSVVSAIGGAIIENLPLLLESGLMIIQQLATSIASGLPQLLPTIVDVVISIVETLIDNVDMLIDGAVAIIIALAEGLINALPRLLEKAPEIIAKLVQAIIDNAPQLLRSALQLIVTLVQGIVQNLPKIVQSAGQIIASLLRGIGNAMGQILQIGRNIVEGIWQGITNAFGWLTGKISGFFSGVLDFVRGILGIGSPSKVFATIGGFMAQGVGVGWDKAFDKVKGGIESDLDFDGNATLGVSGGLTAGAGYGIAGGITINVYAAQGQSEEEIARKVERRIAQNILSREAVWA